METASPLIPSGAPRLPSPEALVDNAKSASTSFFSSRWFRYGLLVLILAILGFNLFNYLGTATDKVSSIVGPIVKPIAKVFGDTVGDATKQTVSVAAKGASAAINKTADVTTGGIDKLQHALHSKTQDAPPLPHRTPGAPVATASTKDDATKKALAHAKSAPSRPEPDDTGSSTQSRKHVGGSGYCFVGQDRGHRTCIQVDRSEDCMSGDIFPTEAICINPALRP